MRKFKIEGISFEVVNNGNLEGNKYDVLWFNEKQCGWNRLTSARTLSDAKEKAYNSIEDGVIVNYI